MICVQVKNLNEKKIYRLLAVSMLVSILVSVAFTILKDNFIGQEDYELVEENIQDFKPMHSRDPSTEELHKNFYYDSIYSENGGYPKGDL